MVFQRSGQRQTEEMRMPGLGLELLGEVQLLREPSPQMENAAVKSTRPLSLEGGGEQGKVDGREVGGPGAWGRVRPL